MAQTSSSTFMTCRKSFNAKVTGRSVFSCAALHKQTAGLKSYFLYEETVFLCVGDSLEKTSWGLRKREASKQEDRGCAPPHSIFPPCPQRMWTQASLTSQEVNLCKGVRSWCHPVMLLSSAPAGGQCLVQGRHVSYKVPLKKCKLQKGSEIKKEMEKWFVVTLR